jgi:hypothetical protein
MANDLFEYMRDATQSMQAEYERIAKRSRQDPGTAGDNGEENWRALLKQWLPANYHVVTKGRIMNAKGECSPQVDVLVLSPSYPPALIYKKEYLAAGVLAAFECKLTLESDHITRALENARDISRLMSLPPESTPFDEIYSPIRYGLLSHSHSWHKPDSKPVDNVGKRLLSDSEKIAQNPRELLDMVCVADLATWDSLKMIVAGPEMLQQMSARYGNDPELWRRINAEHGVIESLFVCSTAENQWDEEHSKSFTPIGSFITALLNKLAWVDIGIQSLAQYFTVSELGGTGIGQGDIWSYLLLSEQLQTRIAHGTKLVVGAKWNKWSMVM